MVFKLKNRTHPGGFPKGSGSSPLQRRASTLRAIYIYMYIYYNRQAPYLIEKKPSDVEIRINDGIYIRCSSEIRAHLRINRCYLICIRHLIMSREVTNPIFFSNKNYFPLCVRNMILLFTRPCPAKAIQ